MDNNIDEKRTEPIEEVDLAELLRTLWRKRGFIIKVVSLFLAIGLFLAIFSPVKYSTSSTLVPQLGEKNISGTLGGLAALAGINLGNMGGKGDLSPKIYPKIVESVVFGKELMGTKITPSTADSAITVYEYFTNKKYHKFNLISFLKRYTLGIPGVVIEEFKESKLDSVQRSLKDSISKEAILTLSIKEEKVLKILNKVVTLSLNEKEGYVTINTTMPEAITTAQLNQSVQDLLQKYITEFRVAKVSSNLDFVEKNFEEAKKSFYIKQSQLARFRDANRGFSSAVAKTEEERLTSEYSLAFTVYNELAKQLEQAKIAVKETIPILSVIDPVVVPTKKSAPKRALIILGFLFAGFVTGCGLIITRPFFEKLKK